MSRVVTGDTSAIYAEGQASHHWSFYGDDRLNEVITVYDETARIVRRSAS